MALSNTVMIPGGNPDTFNATALQHPGDLGAYFGSNGKVYQIVQLDSATDVTAAANQVVTWKDKAAFVVTNKLANGLRNSPAGILRNVVPAASYCAILVEGDAIAVKSSAGGVGDTLIVASGTAADATNIAAGTAPTYLPIGTVTVAVSGGNVTANVAIRPAE